jgi:High potential iron-sulfur protein
MRSSPLNPARRSFLLSSAEVAGLATITVLTCRSGPATAKAAKSDFMYQDHQHDGKSCDQCKFFSPSGPNLDTGSCSIVAGTISSEGWCAAFSPKVHG